MSLVEDVSETDLRELIQYQPLTEKPKVEALIADLLENQDATDLTKYMKGLELQFYWTGMRDAYAVADQTYLEVVNAGGSVEKAAIQFIPSLDAAFELESQKSLADAATITVAYHQGITDARISISTWIRKVVTL